MFLQDDSMAVHSTTTGDTLWRTSLEQEDQENIAKGEYTTLFLTEDIAGFATQVYEKPYDEDEDNEFQVDPLHVLLQFYDTEKGSLISSVKILEQCIGFSDCPHRVLARGSILCYKFHMDSSFSSYEEDPFAIYIFRAVGKELKRHVLQFPLNHFIEQEQIDFPSDAGTQTKLLGFLGKTNILLGNLTVAKYKYQIDQSNPEDLIKRHVLFTVNLDTVFAAKDEEETNLAFAIHEVCTYSDPNSLYKRDPEYFHPVYKTDQATKSVDLVGVMWKKDSGDGSQKIVVESKIFVTEMEC